jgi:hypothetical protein
MSEMPGLKNGIVRLGAVASLVSVAGMASCQEVQPHVPAAQAHDGKVINQGGAGPAPGRTEAERQARKDYYQGPRGDEF